MVDLRCKQFVSETLISYAIIRMDQDPDTVNIAQLYNIIEKVEAHITSLFYYMIRIIPLMQPYNDILNLQYNNTGNYIAYITRRVLSIWRTTPVPLAYQPRQPVDVPLNVWSYSISITSV